MSGSLRMSNCKDEIQLNRKLPALLGEMCVPGGVMGIEITRIKVSEEFGRSSGEKVQGQEAS